MRHLINTFIDGGEKCEKAWLEPKLKESLAKKPNALRLSADVTALLRALAKGVGEGIALYAKGEGAKNFRPWLKKQQHLAQTFYISLNRVDKGVRQDSKTEAAFSAYYNRAVIVEFLKSVHYNKKDNLLRNNLFIMLTCDEIIGAMRGRAAFHDKLTTRLRFFSASNELDGWSCLNMAEVLELLRKGLTKVIETPAKMLDPVYDMFAPLAATVPAYASYLRELETATALAIDGKTRLPSISAVRKEIYLPSDATNLAATANTLEQIKAFATGMLNTLTKGQGARYVDGGEYSVEQQMEEMLEAFANTDRNTNPCESYFGALKFYDDLFHCESYNTNAVVASKRDRIYGGDNSHKYVCRSSRRGGHRSSTEKKRRRAEEQSDARLDAFGDEMSSAIMCYGRTEGKRKYKADALADAAAADEASHEKEEEKKKEMLEKQVELFAKAQDSFATTPIVDNESLSGHVSLATLAARIDAALMEKSSALRVRLLKTNIERFVYGMGFSDMAPKSYTSEVDATIGKAGSGANIAFLRKTLIDIYEEIKENKLALADEAVVPAMICRKLPTLGTTTQQRARLESEQMRSVDELRSDVDAYRARPRTSRARARASSEGVEREPLPEVNETLKGRRVQVMFELEYNRKGGSVYRRNVWCAGEITDVSAAGMCDASGSKRRKLGTGWVWIEYDDKTAGWLLATRPTFFNAVKPGGWRFEPEEEEDDDDDDDDNDGKMPDGVCDDDLEDPLSSDSEEDDDL